MGTTLFSKSQQHERKHNYRQQQGKLTQVLHPNDIRILQKYLVVGEKGDGTVSKKEQEGKIQKIMTTNELRAKILLPIPEWTFREICITITTFIAGESIKNFMYDARCVTVINPRTYLLNCSYSGSVYYIYDTCNRYVSF